jgi:hypothetical protein
MSFNVLTERIIWNLLQNPHAESPCGHDLKKHNVGIDATPILSLTPATAGTPVGCARCLPGTDEDDISTTVLLLHASTKATVLLLQIIAEGTVLLLPLQKINALCFTETHSPI